MAESAAGGGGELVPKGIAPLRDPATGDWSSSISPSPDGRLLAAADMSGKVLIYSLIAT